jgi:hypothetical protein
MRPSRTSLVAALLVLNLALVPGLGSATRGGDRFVGVDRAVEIARDHVADGRVALGLGSGDVADLAVTSAYRSAHNGVTHVYLRQRHRGITRRPGSSPGSAGSPPAARCSARPRRSTPRREASV